MTAEEFFRKKIKELYPFKEVITLANETITAEQGLRWAHEFSLLSQPFTNISDGKMIDLGEKYASQKWERNGIWDVYQTEGQIWENRMHNFVQGMKAMQQLLSSTAKDTEK